MNSFYKSMLDVIKIIGTLFVYGVGIFLATMIVSGVAGCNQVQSGQIAACVSVPIVMVTIVISVWVNIWNDGDY